MRVGILKQEAVVTKGASHTPPMRLGPGDFTNDTVTIAVIAGMLGGLVDVSIA